LGDGLFRNDRGHVPNYIALQPAEVAIFFKLIAVRISGPAQQNALKKKQLDPVIYVAKLVYSVACAFKFNMK
jgi:hypothetical protein